MGCRVRRRAAHAVALALITLLLVGGTVAFASQATGDPLFFMRDPVADDWGAGSLSYPRNEAFHPYSELLDLVAFSVNQGEGTLVFEFQMGRLANPWGAPEGFFHPRIDLYIHTGDSGGRLEPLRPGPGVKFSPRHPWHVWLRVAPFGGSALFTWEDAPQSPGRQRGVSVSSDVARGSIRVELSSHLLPTAAASWRYYVLVGSFDGFGADGYRGVGGAESEWLLGSEQADESPRVVDLLAPGWGPRRQERQLAAKAHDGPTIRPVGGVDLFRYPLSRVLIGLAAVVALGALAIVWSSKSRFDRSGGPT